MKNLYDVTLRVETDEEGLVNIRVLKVQEIMEEGDEGEDE